MNRPADMPQTPGELLFEINRLLAVVKSSVDITRLLIERDGAGGDTQRQPMAAIVQAADAIAALAAAEYADVRATAASMRATAGLVLWQLGQPQPNPTRCLTHLDMLVADVQLARMQVRRHLARSKNAS